MQKKVISLGQCNFDHSQLVNLFNKLEVEVVRVNLNSELQTALTNSDPSLILVNRINDSDGSSGLEVIKELKSSPLTAKIPVMLVSNYAEAQAEAASHGAVPGFGKSQLGSSELIEHLKAYVK